MPRTVPRTADRPAAAHEVRLLGSEPVAAGTFQFRLTRPSGFEFEAGQSVTLALTDPPAEPNSAHRAFSLASAPSDPELAVATRMREGSAYKRALGALPAGASLRLRGPRGTMTLHEDAARAAVFIAGGIGITPFLSMLRQAARERSVRAMRLAYSNRAPGDAPYLAELKEISRTLPHFRLHAQMSDAQGFLDAGTLKRLAGDAGAPVYYVAGPPAMVEAMKRILHELRVGEGDVKSEQFYGY